MRKRQTMHGNRVLLTTLLIFAWSSGVWMMAGLRSPARLEGWVAGSYLLLSLAFIAAILCYRSRLRRAPPFTNQSYATRLLTLSWMDCAVGGAAAIVAR